MSHADVAVLFARADSYYKTLPGVDVYDMERDARTYDGPWPVVAHPPCRAWGRLRHMASPRADERNLARLAVALVREFGGVLEHPAANTLRKLGVELADAGDVVLIKPADGDVDKLVKALVSAAVEDGASA